MSARAAKVIYLVDDVYDASHDTTVPNGAILEYVHSFRMSMSKYMGHVADAVENQGADR